jgi:hypothetical protein
VTGEPSPAEPRAPDEARSGKSGGGPLRMAEIGHAWWPLALSWLLMGVEQPAIAAIVARLRDPAENLAAYGGVVFPIALVVEAPIIMLLAASTELCRDREAYRSLRAFTHRAGAVLTCVHLLVAATPLYGWLVQGLLGVPDAVAERAQIGLILLLPWTWSIAWRRFNQGVLIRFGYSRTVGVATGIRLVSVATMLGTGFMLGDRFSGVVVAASAMSVGVIAEAIYVSMRVRKLVRPKIQTIEPERAVLRGRSFLAFYVPLAMMPIVTLIVQPIGTAAISRMPDVVASLAVWPVVNGLVFVLQSVGLAYNEVVVALLDRERAEAMLRRFTWLLTLATTLLLALLAFTPAADLWFGTVAGLPDRLRTLAAGALWIALPIPGTRVLQSWWGGILVGARRTAAITEAVIVFFVVCTGVLFIGAALQRWSGLETALYGFALGRIFQTTWLAIRCTIVKRALRRSNG